MSKNISSSGSQLKLRSELHLLRKLWHLGSGLTGLFLHLSLNMSKVQTATILLILAVSSFSLEVLRIRVAGVNKLVVKFIGPFMRESERSSISGFPFYALGTSLALFFFSEKIAILAILFLIFSDPISSTFGVLYGKDKILGNKSLQGSIAGFVTCYLITMIYLLGHGIEQYTLIWFAMFAAIIGSFSELMSTYIDDNLTIPLVSGAGITLLNYFFHFVS